ncbi:MAG: helix-turn-helix transcriptional regulator [Planctomycetaceae bacterium]|nr:helix-turn-helix transcriptional regulator [Planctomycetaceae bacterium]
MVSRELIAASTRPLVLAVLAKGENYGYAIIQQVRELSGGDLEWSEGMLYPVLHRLEQEKLIVGFWKEAENGRQRRYYRTSAAGKKALEKERIQWQTVHSTLTALWESKLCLT